MGTAHGLHSENRERVNLGTHGGTLTARMTDDDSITLTFPAATVTEMPLPTGLAEAFAAEPEVRCSTGAVAMCFAV
jgi:hypothetical protein